MTEKHGKIGDNESMSIASEDVGKNTTYKASIGSFLLLHVSFLVYSGSSILAKSAAMAGVLSPKFYIFVLFELMTLCVYAVLWQQALRKFTLVTAYSSKGVVVIWNMLWAVLLFGEHITLENAIGAVVVIAGILVVSKDAN